MGHIRIGRLPKTLHWQGVVNLLDQAPDDVPAIARASLLTAEGWLRQLSHDPSLTYCFWLLTRVSWTARTPDFSSALNGLGIAPPSSNASALAFIAQMTNEVQAHLRRYPESGPFGELASLAFRRALAETVGQHGQSLFGSSLDEVQHAFRSHSSASRFGGLSRRFFGDFLARTLRFFLDRELPNQVGTGHSMGTIKDGQQFMDALDTYVRQSAYIMEGFVIGWYGKHNWESGGEINYEEARGFVAVALRKLRMELVRTEP
jgi:hypothetical protein